MNAAFVPAGSGQQEGSAHPSRVVALVALVAFILDAAAHGQDVVPAPVEPNSVKAAPSGITSDKELVPAPADLRLHSQYEPLSPPPPLTGSLFPPALGSVPKKDVDSAEPDLPGPRPLPKNQAEAAFEPPAPDDLALTKRLAQAEKRLGLAITSYNSGAPDRALEILDASIREFPECLNFRLWRAHILMERAHWKAAIEDLDSILAVSPTWVDVLRRRAHCRMQLAWAGDQSYAVPALSDAEYVLDGVPNDPEARAIRGVVAIIRRQYDRAIAELSDVIEHHVFKRDSDLDWVLCYRAIAFIEMGDWQRAIADLSLAIKHRPNSNDARLYCWRASSYFENGDLDHALADLGEVIRLSPKDDEALLERAYVRWLNGDIAGTKADMDSVAQIEARDWEVYSNRAHCALVLLNDHERALADLDRAVALETRDAYDYALRSYLHAQKKQFVVALTDLTLFIRTRQCCEVQIDCGVDRKSGRWWFWFGYGLKEGLAKSKPVTLGWNSEKKRPSFGIQTIGTPSRAGKPAG
jgi:tetratricopeptide (TPR) repeat protein